MNEFPLMTLEELCSAVHGVCIGSRTGQFYSVCTDSRNAVRGALFVPLMGEFQDGHNYISGAVKNGAAVVLVDENHREMVERGISEKHLPEDVSYVIVKNTLKGLQDAAAGYLKKFPGLKKIGITGSCGKTTTKEIFASVFSVKYDVVMTEGNLNSETGLPLSVFNVRDNHQVGIFEAGMNRVGEIRELAEVLKPDIAVITNIGTAHIGILGTRDKIAEEKKSIFSFFNEKSIGIIPEADDYYEFLKTGVPGKILSFGDGNLREISRVNSLGLKGTEIIFKTGDRALLSIPGYYNYLNALAAITAGFEWGLTVKEVAEGINSVKPLFGRSQVFEGSVEKNGINLNVTVVQDCYNANPVSLKAGLSLCDSADWNGKRLYVVGAMMELGADSYQAHYAALQNLADSKGDLIFLFGKEFKKPFDDFKPAGSRFFYFEDMEDLIAGVKSGLENNSLIFIKGSRAMALERIGESLGLVKESAGV